MKEPKKNKKSKVDSKKKKKCVKKENAITNEGEININKKEIKGTIDIEENEEDKIIKEIMGFSEFSSSKNKSHVDSDLSGCFLGRKVKRIYQRFMNYKPFNKFFKIAYMNSNTNE